MDNVTRRDSKGNVIGPARYHLMKCNDEKKMQQYKLKLKRQEEMKKLALADEDDYLNSQWADPKGMKKSLQGLNDVKAPGFR